jgi:hypothetical protein
MEHIDVDSYGNCLGNMVRNFFFVLSACSFPHSLDDCLAQRTSRPSWNAEAYWTVQVLFGIRKYKRPGLCFGESLECLLR